MLSQALFMSSSSLTFSNILELLPEKYLLVKGPGSSVGIATDYGLDGPGIESR
jgi:hypothetical protein